MSREGTYIRSSTAGETVEAFVPAPLPPDPPLSWTPEDRSLWAEAQRALGRLDAFASLIPETTEHLLYMHVRKEAVVSSQIEGTQSSLSDLLLYEDQAAPGVPTEDVEEVSRYVAALNHGLERVRGGFPLSLRLLREMHGILLAEGRGESKQPGEFRRSQNWIGGTRPGNARFVPPPPSHLMDCLGALEKFLHDDPEPTEPLLKSALSHVQFETIHPFLDGNGRLGRLLIPLILCVEGALREPLLYLSLYFKLNRTTYYERLQGVRADGDWEGWVRFFLEGVVWTCEEALTIAGRVRELFQADRERIRELGRRGPNAHRVHELVIRKPLIRVKEASEVLELSFETASKAVQTLEELGILRELTGKKKNRLFGYDAYVKLLEAGAEGGGA